MLSKLSYAGGHRQPSPRAMLIEKLGHLLPFTCAQMFDMAADIERYPEFLPWCISASVVRREANSCYVEQVVGRGAVHVRFASKAVLQRPDRIDITSSDLPFRQFDLSVAVLPAGRSGCSLRIAAQVELRSGFLQQILRRVLARSIDEVVAAFEARAHSLYGQRDR
jgi:coenzyme Q-binding protein COQ10